jgi:hypothetical protein
LEIGRGVEVPLLLAVFPLRNVETAAILLV